MTTTTATTLGKVKCFVGRHDWIMIETKTGGDLYDHREIDQCTRCANGRLTVYYGNKKYTARFSREEMAEWKKQLKPTKVSASGWLIK